jgi:hypothetical protein
MQSSECARAVMSYRRSSPIVGAAGLVSSVARPSTRPSAQSASRPSANIFVTASAGSRKPARDRPGRKPQPPAQHELTQSRLNVTDPDSRVTKDKMTLMQGYNAQVIASPEQVILAAALTQEPNDSRQLPPMIAQASPAIQSAGISEPTGTIVADDGYWSERAVKLAEHKGVSVLVPPLSQANASKHKTAKPHSETAKRPPAAQRLTAQIQ